MDLVKQLQYAAVGRKNNPPQFTSNSGDVFKQYAEMGNRDMEKKEREEKLEQLIDDLEDHIKWWKRAFETDGFESDEESSYRRDLEDSKKKLFNFIERELDKAREEGRKGGSKKLYRSISKELYKLYSDIECLGDLRDDVYDLSDKYEKLSKLKDNK